MHSMQNAWLQLGKIPKRLFLSWFFSYTLSMQIPHVTLPISFEFPWALAAAAPPPVAASLAVSFTRTHFNQCTCLRLNLNSHIEMAVVKQTCSVLTNASATSGFRLNSCDALGLESLTAKKKQTVNILQLHKLFPMYKILYPESVALDCFLLDVQHRLENLI